MDEAPDLGRAVEWARERLSRTWYQARKAAVDHWRRDKSVAWICVAMSVDRQWVHKWVDRWLVAGKSWAGLRDRSSRPHRMHRRRDAHVDAVIGARRRYPHLGAAKLCVVAKLELSHDTVHRILAQHGLVKKSKKRGWTKVRRFQRPTPNYLWQLDITQVKAKDGVVWIATLLDDCTRFVIASKDYEQDLNAGDVVGLVRDAIGMWGKPRQVLTDRGTQFHSNQSEDPSMFTLALHALGIQHIRARPRHPRTCGKIERWHRSLKREWLDQHPQPENRAHLRAILDAWIEHYNTVRPHWALGNRVPVEAFLEGFYLEDDLYRLVNEVA